MTNKKIFDALNSTRHITRKNPQLDIFAEYELQTSYEPDNEFWYLSDLHNILGPSIIPEPLVFGNEICSKIVIPYNINKKKFKELDTNQKYSFTKQHSERMERTIQLNTRPYPNNIDHKATRYACWSFVKDNPNATFARLYFICTETPFDKMNKIASEYARIHSRQELSTKEHQLAGIIKRMGGTYSLFYHTTTPAMFDGLTADNIKECYNLPPKRNEPLADYLNDITLRARTNAIERTINKFNTYSNQNITKLHDTLCEELRAARRQIVRITGRVPEAQIARHNIAFVEKHRKENELLFIQKYSNQKIR